MREPATVRPGPNARLTTGVPDGMASSRTISRHTWGSVADDMLPKRRRRTGSAPPAARSPSRTACRRRPARPARRRRCARRYPRHADRASHRRCPSRPSDRGRSRAPRGRARTASPRRRPHAGHRGSWETRAPEAGFVPSPRAPAARPRRALRRPGPASADAEPPQSGALLRRGVRLRTPSPRESKRFGPSRVARTRPRNCTGAHGHDPANDGARPRSRGSQ